MLACVDVTTTVDGNDDDVEDEIVVDITAVGDEVVVADGVDVDDDIGDF